MIHLKEHEIFILLSNMLYIGGVRLGAPALTTRGLKEADFRQVADFLHEAVRIALKLQETAKTTKDFEAAVISSPEVKALRKGVQTFITRFPMPGFDVATMKYKTLDA
jgi:glycine hydroxymethyltransferase